MYHNKPSLAQRSRMRRSDERPHPPVHTAMSPTRDEEEPLQAPSKTQRKAKMHDLQDLGEALVNLQPSRLAELTLPERLVDAVVAARKITKWEARRRQMQFIGRL